ncbi:peptidylprolyl isomerase [Paraferrimonas sp. SM1919]|uniref:peptidylprolyl isomerase n=1 Tax=Paraferrimonas sp. SM1919 TaxID=2662263 RepID=UPI0013D37C38|nr:peptidylprolyl isomerase [Paraferrimonas sp. SM1919]
MITLSTNLGDIVIELDMENTPVTAKNFLRYCNEGFYEGTIFHRTIKGFMVQGGGLDVLLKEKPEHDPIANEANRGGSNQIGTIAMARTDAPHSASSQFFINTADNKFLDHTATTNAGWGYCVFGKVVAGMDVVTEIEKSPTGSREGHDDVPVVPVVIEKVTVA